MLVSIIYAPSMIKLAYWTFNLVSCAQLTDALSCGRH